MMKIMLGIVAVLVGTVVLILVIGWLLPQKHVAARAISLRQKPDAVFALISDFKSAPTWRSDVQEVEVLPATGGNTQFQEKGKNGILTMEVVELSPPTRMVTRIADKSLPFGGTWIFEISPTADGCRLNITEQGEIYNPIFRFVSRLFLGYEGSLNSYLQNVGSKFGENVAPEEGEAAGMGQ